MVLIIGAPVSAGGRTPDAGAWFFDGGSPDLHGSVPSTGAAGVPLNAVLLVERGGGGLMYDVTDSAGTRAVSATESWWLQDRPFDHVLDHVPLTPLPPASTATVTLGHPSWGTIGTVIVHTATRADNQRPVIRGQVAWSYRAASITSGGLDASVPVVRYELDVDVPAVDDDMGVALLAVFRISGATRVARASFLQAGRSVPANVLSYPTSLGGGRHCFSLVAFDQAGNESVPQPPVCLDFVVPRRDGGTADSGPGVDIGPPPLPPDSGPFDAAVDPADALMADDALLADDALVADDAGHAADAVVQTRDIGGEPAADARTHLDAAAGDSGTHDGLDTVDGDCGCQTSRPSEAPRAVAAWLLLAAGIRAVSRRRA